MTTNRLENLRVMMSSHGLILLCVLLFLAIGLARTNDLSLYTDSTRYLIWGSSFAQGQGFVDDTQPVAERYVVNAPLYAAFLAPVLLFFPLSVVAAKIWTLLWGAVVLILLYRWLIRFTTDPLAIAAVLFLAVNPLMLVISTEVLSEAAFVTIAVLSFILAEKLEAGQGSNRDNILLNGLLSVVMLLREIGVALVAAFVITFLLRGRYKQAAAVVLSAGAMFALWTWRNMVLVGIPADDQAPNLKFFFGHFVTPPDASLANELLTRASINLSGYFGETGGSLFYRFPMNLMVAPGSAFTAVSGIISAINIVLGIVLAVLLAGGIVYDLRHSRTSIVRLLFLVFYTTIILVYPVHDIRFQLPLLPLALFYIVRVFDGVRLALLDKRKQFPLWAGSVAFFLVAVPNLLCVAETVRTNLAYRSDPVEFWRVHKGDASDAKYFGTPWGIMGEMILKHVESQSVVASSEKEIVPFAPGIKFLEINRGVPLPMLEGLLRTHNVSHLIAAESYGNVETFQVSLTASSRFRLELTDTVAGLRLYKVHQRLREPVRAPKEQVLTLSTTDVGDLMQLGRLSLQAARHFDALQFFSMARDKFSRQSEITFYLLIAHALAGDSLEAVQELRRLYASPSATSFIPPARVFLHTMNELKLIRANRDDPRSSDRMFQVARTVWNLGYGRQAFDLLNELVRTDPNHFESLLWTWHIGIQLGDTSKAEGILKNLQAIDSSNAVVKSFTKMTRLHRELSRVKDSAEASRIHVLLAEEYGRIDLPEESFDEVERALRLNPGSEGASTLLTSLKGKRK
jgi:tetratricopeptide (TPR) repeat protein